MGRQSKGKRRAERHARKHERIGRVQSEPAYDFTLDALKEANRQHWHCGVKGMAGGRWQKAVVESATMGSCELLLRACRTKGNRNGASVKTVCGQVAPPFFTFRRSCKGGGSANTITYDEERTPLHIAIRRGHVRVVRALMQLGCDIEKESRGVTAIQMACQRHPTWPRLDDPSWRRAGSGLPRVDCFFGRPVRDVDLFTQRPINPAAPDCVHFMRTGRCSFGRDCAYNHPTGRAWLPEDDQNWRSAKQVALPELALSPGRPDRTFCKRTGFCGLGERCWSTQSPAPVPGPGPDSVSASASASISHRVTCPAASRGPLGEGGVGNGYSDGSDCELDDSSDDERRDGNVCQVDAGHASLVGSSSSSSSNLVSGSSISRLLADQSMKADLLSALGNTLEMARSSPIREVGATLAGAFSGAAEMPRCLRGATGAGTSPGVKTSAARAGMAAISAVQHDAMVVDYVVTMLENGKPVHDVEELLGDVVDSHVARALVTCAVEIATSKVQANNGRLTSAAYAPDALQQVWVDLVYDAFCKVCATQAQGGSEEACIKQPSAHVAEVQLMLGSSLSQKEVRRATQHLEWQGRLRSNGIERYYPVASSGGLAVADSRGTCGKRKYTEAEPPVHAKRLSTETMHTRARLHHVEDVLLSLVDAHGGRVSLLQAPTLYAKQAGEPLDWQSMGFSRLQDLIRDIPTLCTPRGGGGGGPGSLPVCFWRRNTEICSIGDSPESRAAPSRAPHSLRCLVCATRAEHAPLAPFRAMDSCGTVAVYSCSACRQETQLFVGKAEAAWSRAARRARSEAAATATDVVQPTTRQEMREREARAVEALARFIAAAPSAEVPTTCWQDVLASKFGAGVRSTDVGKFRTFVNRHPDVFVRRKARPGTPAATLELTEAARVRFGNGS